MVPIANCALSGDLRVQPLIWEEKNEEQKERDERKNYPIKSNYGMIFRLLELSSITLYR